MGTACAGAFSKAPEVQPCFYVTGGISFVLVIVVQDMPAYEAPVRRLFSENELVVDFRTLIAPDRVEAGTTIVLP